MAGFLKTRHQPGSVSATVLRVAFFLLLLSIGFAYSAKAGVTSQSRPELSITGAPQFAIADFDGDNRPDLASVDFGWAGSQNYAINFRLTSGSQRWICIAAPEGGLQLRTGDVNGDSFPDVVVSTLWTDRPVAVLLNDGRGNFTLSAPSAFPDAFRESENSIASSDGIKSDAVAALFIRYSAEPWDEDGNASSPLNLVGYAALEPFHFVCRPICNSSFGRAPPSLAIHS